jgi:hypothetical protein
MIWFGGIAVLLAALLCFAFVAMLYYMLLMVYYLLYVMFYFLEWVQGRFVRRIFPQLKGF